MLGRVLLVLLPLSITASGCYDSRLIRDAGQPLPEEDAEVACSAPQIDCGEGECVDPTGDPSHCGGCGIACDVGSTCAAGVCMTGCTPSCEGAECGDDGCSGSCGECGAGFVCVSGTCTSDGSEGESCGAATVLSPTGGTYSFAFTGRTADHTPFTCGSTSGQPDVAFRFTPAFSGTATFETSSPDGIDTVMAAYTESSCATPSACDDDGGTNRGSFLALAVTAGATYYVVVAPYGSTTPAGSVTLTVTAP